MDEGTVGDWVLEGGSQNDRKWWKEKRIHKTAVMGVAVISNDKS